MANFGGLILTNKGRALQAKAQAGTALVFNRIGVGDGELGSTSISTLNALVDEKMSLAINKLKTQSGGKAIVGGVLSNQDVVTGFYFREIGIFAQDPNDGEILYCYANAGAGAEYIPAGGGPDVVEKQIDIITLTANAATVTADISSGIYALSSDVGDMSTVPTTSKVVAGAITELFTSVSDGKTLVAAAITGKGVPTAADDTFTVMADNIDSIVLGSGTALPGDVRAGETFSNDNGTGQVGTLPVQAGGNVVPVATDIVKAAGIYDTAITVKGVVVPAANVLAGTTIAGTAGTMPECGAVTITPSAVDQAIAAGHHSGAGKVLAVPVDESKVLVGTTIAGQAGTMPNRAGDTSALASSVSGTTLKLRASNGYRDGVNDNVTLTDADFIAANILSGKNIFGLAGSLAAGKKFASGNVTSGTTGQSFVYTTGSSTGSLPYITVAGLTFKPSIILISGTANLYIGIYAEGYNLYYDKGFIMTSYTDDSISTQSYNFKADYPSASVTSSGFTLPTPYGYSIPYKWIAIE